MQKTKGIIFIIGAAFGFSLMSVFVRLSGNSLPPFQKAFFRNAAALVLIGIVMLRRHISPKPKKANLAPLLARSLFGTAGLLCNFYAIDRLVLADSNMLNKLSPFFAILFSMIILREKPHLVQLCGIAAAFAGSVLIIKPGLEQAPVFPALIGALGGLCAGAAYTFVRLLGLRGENGLRIIFWFSTVSCLVCVPFIIFDHAAMSLTETMYLILAGLAATLGQFCITKAYFFAPAREISVYDYTQVIFAAAFGYFLFAQIPDAYSILGYILITGAGVAMFLYNKRKA